MILATISVEPPAANGTINRIGRDGYDLASIGRLRIEAAPDAAERMSDRLIFKAAISFERDSRHGRRIAARHTKKRELLLRQVSVARIEVDASTRTRFCLQQRITRVAIQSRAQLVIAHCTKPGFILRRQFDRACFIVNAQHFSVLMVHTRR